MAVIAVYNVKGGVGKTSLAVNLGWCSARQSARRTLIWDLDPQGGAGQLLGLTRAKRLRAKSVLERAADPVKLICKTPIDGLDLLPADASLAGIDHYLEELGKKKRLARLSEDLLKHYDRIIFDCPPVLNEMADQAIRAADLLVVPVTPSPLAGRALSDLRQHLLQNYKRHAAILPVVAMYDARRTLHRALHEAEPDWPVIPMSSLVEQMGIRELPLAAWAATSKPAMACAALWTEIEKRLAAVA